MDWFHLFMYEIVIQTWYISLYLYLIRQLCEISIFKGDKSQFKEYSLAAYKFRIPY